MDEFLWSTSFQLGKAGEKTLTSNRVIAPVKSRFLRKSSNLGSTFLLPLLACAAAFGPNAGFARDSIWA